MALYSLRSKVSRYVSYLLRHNPAGLEMDKHGFVSLHELLQKINMRFQVKSTFLLQIVEKSDNKRFEVVEGRVRALYGHSVPVELELEEERDIEVFYHGTTEKAVPKIMREGLRSMKRSWVHLSPTADIAVNVGLRRTARPIVLEIDAKAAREEGTRFYKATSNVFLCRQVRPRHIRVAFISTGYDVC